ncbi:EAL domain-containing protein [Roseomonas xinghualingensis]|uniref:EAL domain-containing protein n=1 Tax=Roseomonas xinghualingensis TaxID=2986475 RepID=UPI0021F116EB|nr:EAL domain-containing protein [Roseomonas sp. SXEYE001]MCV4208902.1 EAL domain-containing protein [Roseomonas sp. SXEYE001]
MPIEPVHKTGLPSPPPPGCGEILAVIQSSSLLSLVQDGLRRIGAPPARQVPLSEAMARLARPGQPLQGLLCEPHPDMSGWTLLSEAARDSINPTNLLLLGHDDLTEDPAELLTALRNLTGLPGPSEAEEVAALRLSLERGEVAMCYQPIVRIADRKPLAVEGLVRWLRPDGNRGMTPVGPDSFVRLAERGGLAGALARAVSRIAASEMRALRPALALPVSINMPLEVLLRRDTVAWLGRLCREQRLPPKDLAIELTEGTPVQDVPLLGRAVARLRQAGHLVWIDDMSLEENRDILLDLPFSGLKLDRHLLGATRHSRRARAEVERLVAMAHARGMTVTAEGVADAALWQTVAWAGVDHAQGYAVGRPLPAADLPSWAAAWRHARRPARQAED